MPVRLNGLTSGYTELSAPAVAGNNSIALPTGNGSAYQILRNGATAGSLEYTDKLVSMTANAGGTNPFPTTGGPTAVDFTGIPSWVKRVTVMFNGVSTNGSSAPQIQLGTVPSIETSGYIGGVFASLTTSCNAQGGSTSGMDIYLGGATVAHYGQMIITNVTGNVWVSTYTMAHVGASYPLGCGASSKTLSGALTRLRLTTVNGTDTFDAGSINILYE